MNFRIIKKHKLKSEKGFTLAEIAISIFILASSFVVMLGLEHASIQQTMQDQNKRLAMSYARKIMSYIDISGEDASSGERKIDVDAEAERENSLPNFLREFEIEDEIDDKTDEGLKDRLEKFNVVLKTSYPKIGGIDVEELVILVELTISWGETDREQIKLVRLVEPENSGSINSDDSDDDNDEN